MPVVRLALFQAHARQRHVAGQADRREERQLVVLVVAARRSTTHRHLVRHDVREVVGGREAVPGARHRATLTVDVHIFQRIAVRHDVDDGARGGVDEHNNHAGRCHRRGEARAVHCDGGHEDRLVVLQRQTTCTQHGERGIGGTCRRCWLSRHLHRRPHIAVACSGATAQLEVVDARLGVEGSLHRHTELRAGGSERVTTVVTAGKDGIDHRRRRIHLRGRRDRGGSEVHAVATVHGDVEGREVSGVAGLAGPVAGIEERRCCTGIKHGYIHESHVAARRDVVGLGARASTHGITRDRRLGVLEPRPLHRDGAPR